MEHGGMQAARGLGHMVSSGGETTVRRWTLRDKGGAVFLIPKSGKGVSGPSSPAWNCEQVSGKVEFRKQKPICCSKELGVCKITGWPRDRNARDTPAVG